MQMVAACGTWVFGLPVVGLVWSCRFYVSRLWVWNPDTQNLQLHTRPTTSKSQTHVPQAATIYIILELLMMGIMVPRNMLSGQ